jgi:hypothetical protein
MNADRANDHICATTDMREKDPVREIAEASRRTVGLMVGVFLASMAIFFTAVTVVLNNAALPPEPPAQPVAQVIIQVSPQGVTILPAAPAAQPQP